MARNVTAQNAYFKVKKLKASTTYKHEYEPFDNSSAM